MPLTDDERWFIVSGLAEVMKDLVYAHAFERANEVVAELEQHGLGVIDMNKSYDKIDITYTIGFSGSLLDIKLAEYRRRCVHTNGERQKRVLPRVERKKKALPFYWLPVRKLVRALSR